MLGRTDRRLRLVVLLAAFAVAATAIGARLAYWQVARAADLQELARAQLETRVVDAPQRGDIYDRTGTTVLATTGFRDLLAAYPDQISRERDAAVARALGGILGLDNASIRALRRTLASDRPYVVIERQLTEAESRAVRRGLADGALEGVALEPQPVRYYPSPGGSPDATLASHLLGFVDSEGRGQYGIEERYQDLLAGRPRITSALRGMNGQPIVGSDVLIDPGTPGSDLRLTIDASLQLQVERELYAAWVADSAVSASAIVMDPATGEILAWATAPGYDANEYRSIARQEPTRFIDPIVSKVYEPGSVMKMLVAAAAYERGIVDARTAINDTGTMRIGDGRVDDSDKRAMGWMPFEDVIAYSRNVGAARAGMMLGEDNRSASIALYQMWRRLGFGQETGVDVAGEVPGLVVDPAIKEWAPIDLANASFGQGIAVTPVQLVTAFTAMVNGGTLVQPHLVADVGGQPVSQAASRQVLDTALSNELRRLMTHVVTEVPWYAEGTLIPGYLVGGKTGTAQIWDSARGRWIPDRFNFSFVGFAGRSGVDAVIAVQIHRGLPEIRGQGNFKLGITSYELFRRIAIDTMSALDISPARPRARENASPAPDTRAGERGRRGAPPRDRDRRSRDSRRPPRSYPVPSSPQPGPIAVTAGTVAAGPAGAASPASLPPP